MRPTKCALKSYIINEGRSIGTPRSTLHEVQLAGIAGVGTARLASKLASAAGVAARLASSPVQSVVRRECPVANGEACLKRTPYQLRSD